MKLLTIDVPPHGHAGVLLDDQVLDLAAARAAGSAASWMPATVRAILEAGDEGLEIVRACVGRVESATEGERDRLREIGALRPFDSTPLLAPIPDPRLIMSEGLNYGRHLEEMSNTPWPEHPTAFIKVAASLTGSGKPIVVPPQCPDMIDYEGEFTFVFGRACHRVPAEDAMGYVAGYTLVNDVSARDWVPEVRAAEGAFGAIHAWERNIMGKNLPTFSPCGPVLTTSDEIADPHDLQLATRLNGEVMQSTKTDDLIFKIPELISYFSQWYQFSPGDLFTTGSPSGVGFGRNPPVFMKPGDTVEVEAEGVGILTNRLVAGE